MSAKRCAFLIILLCLVASSSYAQVNEVAVTVGRTFVSTRTILNDPTSLYPRIHFGNEESIAFNYARLLKIHGIFGFSAEVPVAIVPRMDLNTYLNQIPKDIGALFATPSLRVNFFPGQGLTPWVSGGGGYGRWRQSSDLNYYGKSSAPTGINTGVLQFGAGVDVWPWHRWGLRGEARDFYSGAPNFNANPSLPAVTGHGRQHNFYVGGGVIRRF